MSEVEVGTLDLTGADTSGFEAIDAGRYSATVWEASWKESGGEGKMPQGAPYLNVQFRLSDPPNENRRVFSKYFPVPYEGQEPDKAKKSQGMFVNFLTALGYEESNVKSKKFSLDLEELKGKECVVVLNKKFNDYTSEMENNVTGVKKAGEATGSQAAGGLL